MHQIRSYSQHRSISFAVASLVVLLCSFVSFAQTAADALSGKYEGLAKVEGSADQKLSLDIKNEGGKISGQLVSGQMTSDVSEGTFVDGKLTLKLGAAAKDGVISAKLDNGKLAGEWMVGAQKRTVGLTKVAAAKSADAIDLNGQWEGIADAEGQPFPFLLVLKVDGETVTGSGSSQLGESIIKSGTWKDGKLNFQLESPSGVILMTGVVIEGKLSGEFDYTGEAQGKWVAVKKN